MIPQNLPKRLCQKGEISPNLVTLVVGTFNQKAHSNSVGTFATMTEGLHRGKFENFLPHFIVESSACVIVPSRRFCNLSALENMRYSSTSCFTMEQKA